MNNGQFEVVAMDKETLALTTKIMQSIVNELRPPVTMEQVRTVYYSLSISLLGRLIQAVDPEYRQSLLSMLAEDVADATKICEQVFESEETAREAFKSGRLILAERNEEPKS